MLLVIDVGNTNLVFGLFTGEKVTGRWRMATKRYAQADDLGAFVLAALATQRIPLSDVSAVAISSVVPPITSALREMAGAYFNLTPFIVEPGINTPLAIGYDNPRLLGPDRAANAVAAIHYYGGPVIIADLGTATKFEAINASNEYLGGAIAPGLNIAADALIAGSALLYRVDLATTPRAVIGQDTTTAVQSGIRLGYIAMVEGMVERFRNEMALRDPAIAANAIRVVATGGLAYAVADQSAESISVIDPDLTLQGVRLVYEANLPL